MKKAVKRVAKAKVKGEPGKVVAGKKMPTVYK